MRFYEDYEYLSLSTHMEPFGNHPKGATVNQ
jgi:hypothetical protein